MTKRIFSGLLCCAFCFSLVLACVPVPVKADINVNDVTGFFDWVWDKSQDLVTGFFSLFDDDVCMSSKSPNSRHNFVKMNTSVDSKAGWYYVCEYCGRSAGEVGRDAYNDYVSDLPASIYDSSGRLSWRLVPDDIVPITSSSDYTVRISSSSVYYYSVHGSAGRCYFNSDFLAPFDGTYKVSLVTFSSSNSAGFNFFNSYLRSGVQRVLGSIVISSGIFGDLAYRNSGIPLLWEGYFLLTCVPILPSDTTYNINTRASTITGDVYYFDNNGDAHVYNNCTIVNETNNTYYNPVTRQTKPTGSWTYDYNDRSYTCDCEDGTNTVITFGDDCIVIQEGENTYYVYYGTPPEQHVHEWYLTGRKQATCTDYGTKTYTCYTCGEEKTDVLPALGHDWVQSGYVPAQYDDEGNVIEKAHVLYYCSRCMEEYKDYDGVGPPDDGGGGGDPGGGYDDSGLLTWLQDFKVWLGTKLDALIGGGGGDTIIENDYDITYTDEDGNEQKTSVKGILAAFGWWKQVADIGKTMVSQISAAEVAAYAYDANAPGSNPTGAPSIPVNLAAAQSHYGVQYGGEVEMLDLSWYTPYKQTVDKLVSGFLWLFFVWALVRRAPAIISGSGLMGFDIPANTEGQLLLGDGKKGRRR